MADNKSAENYTRDEDGVLVDEDGIPVLDLSAVENVSEVSRETAIPMPKWGWWILLSICAILVILSVFVPSQGILFGGSALALAVFITHYGQDTLLENYEKRIKERYGDVGKVELSPEQRRELRYAIAEAERRARREKKMERAAKREAKRSGRAFEEVLKEMKAEAKAKEKEEAAADAAADAVVDEDDAVDDVATADDVATDESAPADDAGAGE